MSRECTQKNRKRIIIILILSMLLANGIFFLIGNMFLKFLFSLITIGLNIALIFNVLRYVRARDKIKKKK